ncbi:MAG: DUF962 domain-containing protein [Fuerstiella sp.]|nr:DUF962 domain-containing protein [Fuerstiella sp.]
MIRRFLRNYLPRHTNRANQALHLVGVPLAFFVAPAFWIEGFAWYYVLGCFTGGYLLQFAGHAIEGNDAGEVVFVKKSLGMRYTEYAAARPSSSPSETSTDSNSAG